MTIKYDKISTQLSTASSLDAEKNWNCYAPIQDIFHKNPIYHKKYRVVKTKEIYNIDYNERINQRDIDDNVDFEWI